MRISIIRLLVLVIGIFIPFNIVSQPIIQLMKEDIINLNKIEEEQVKLCFEMEDYLVVSPVNLESLAQADIKYKLLTPDNTRYPLYLISAKDGIKLKDSPYLAQILINEQIRLEKANDSQLDLFPQGGVKYIPVKISPQTYKNKSSKYRHPASRNTSEITDVIEAVNADSVAWFIQELENFDTRFALVDNRREIAEWIASQFTRFGYSDVAIDSFYVESYSTWQYNVVCTEEGLVTPDQVLVIGGHHDSIITPNTNDAYTYAPGADDNASGVSAVLETARVMKLNNIVSNNTIRFVTFAMEEFGLYGAYHDAETLASNNVNVVAMLNSDMISSNSDEDYVFSLRVYPGADGLTDLTTMQGTELNKALSLSDDSINASDSWAYHVNGYPAIFFSEYEFSPYYHSADDISANTDPDYAASLIELIASVAITVGNLPAQPANFSLIDSGDGSSVIAQWYPVGLDNPIYHLEVLDITSEEISSYTCSDTIFTITGLQTNNPYEITLFCEYNDNFSFGETLYISPQDIPQQVENFYHQPLVQAIELNWQLNTESDILGYRIYRKFVEADEYELYESIGYNQNSYVDTETVDSQWYNYMIRAFDIDGNESFNSEIIRGRHLCFNQGIGVYDFSINSTNTHITPSLDSIYAFYEEVLSNYSYQLIPCDSQTDLALDEIGIYSTIIIFKNSLVTPFTNNISDVLASYLEKGGNLIVSANDPLRFLNLTNNCYPVDYITGDFPYDYTGINLVNNNSISRFAKGQSLVWNLPDLEVDPAKAPLGFNGKIFNVEAYATINDPDVINILSYQSGTDIPEENQLDDMIVAVAKRDQHSDSLALLTSIPLYYIHTQQAQAFLETVLDNLISVSNSDNESIPANSQLQMTNYPNPFNPTTTISFYLSEASQVQIQVFNIKGQIVSDEISESLEKGYHHINWEGETKEGKKLSSGIYFYRLSTENGLSETKKMILLK